MNTLVENVTSKYVFSLKKIVVAVDLSWRSEATARYAV
jgi:hypothetical protein